jgi:sulfotransferase
MQKAISASNEAALFLFEQQKYLLLRSVFEECYPESGEVVFDTNRMWPAKLPALVKLFPDCKIICCVRQVAWIMDSIERLVRKNTFDLSGIFGFESGGTVYSRCAGLSASNGLVGFALDALREGFYGEHSDRILMVEYQALTKHPRDTVGAVYEWLGLPYFDGHDYENVEQIPGAAEFDARIGTPGLHSVAARVQWTPRETILPPELFASFPPPFWRSNNPKVPVIHVDEKPDAGVST